MREEVMMQTHDPHNAVHSELLTSDDLAKKFRLNVEWVNKNRRKTDPIPFMKLGRFIRYNSKEIITWLGHEDINLLTPEEVAKQFKLTLRWLRYNRNSHDPIPYKKLGKNIRYHHDDVETWLAGKSKKKN